jgi:hypothetical protein
LINEAFSACCVDVLFVDVQCKMNKRCFIAAPLLQLALPDGG